MPAPTPRTVLIYSDGTVLVVRGHQSQNDPLLTLHGSTPTHVYHVQAAGDSDALRKALLQGATTNVPQYILTIGEQADINLHRLAQRLGISEVDVLRNAINTYATLKNADHDNVFVHSRDAQGKLVVKRLAVP